MLRTLLSVFGVVFIGLGLFGGPLLEQVQQRLTGSPIAVAQISNEQIGNASQKPAVIAVEAPTQVAVQEETATQVLAPEVAPQVLAQATNHSTTPASGELQPAVQVQTSQATVNSISNELSVETKVIPAVAMQKPADEIMSRNEQLAILDKAITSTSVESQIAAQAPVQPTIQEKAVSKVTEQVNSEAPASPALGSDILIVMKDQVNMREGPSIDHPIVLQLQKGQELMEFKREGRWVHVGAYGTSGKIGWVHQRLIDSRN